MMKKFIKVGVICGFLITFCGMSTVYAFWFPPSEITYIAIADSGNYEIQVLYNSTKYC